MKKYLLLIIAVFTLSTAFSQDTWNWDGDNPIGDFNLDHNWWSDTAPTSWDSNDKLIFNTINNASQTSIYFNLGAWKSIESIEYANTIGKSIDFNGDGNGFDFYWKIENLSSHNQKLTIPLSGKGTIMEFNPINGNLTFTNTISNDNNKNINIYGDNGKRVTFEGILEGDASTQMNIKQNSIVHIKYNDPTSFGGGVFIEEGQLWIGADAALNGGAITVGDGDADTCKLMISDDGTTPTIVANTIVIPTDSSKSFIGGKNTSGTHTYSGTVNLNNNIVTFNEPAGGTVNFTGVISGTGQLKKTDSGTVQLSALNDYTGNTQIRDGILELGINDAIDGTGRIELDGGILSSGVTTGYSDTTLGKLKLLDDSEIHLGSDAHELKFVDDAAWTDDKVLTITGWGTGTEGKIFVGTNASILGNTKLALIHFDGYTQGAFQLSTGEIVPVNNDSEAIAQNPYDTSTIPSTTDTFGERVNVFKVKIKDQGSGDALDTKVTNIRIKPHNTNTADWSDHIQGFEVKIQGGATVSPSNVTITDNFIDFTFNTGDVTVLDNNVVVVLFKLYLNTSNIIDGDILSFRVDADDHGFTADPSGSIFAETFDADYNSNDHTIDVVATELRFRQQSTNTAISTAMSPTVTVAGTDENGNTDTAFADDINITSTGTLTGSPITETPTLGIASFLSLTHTVNGSNLTLTAQRQATSDWPVSSDTFIIYDTCSGTNTWDGDNWSLEHAPLLTENVVIDGAYNTFSNGSIASCSLTVNTGNTLKVGNNSYLEVTNDIINNGTIVVTTKGALVQYIHNASGTDISGSGTFKVQKTTTDYVEHDFTYWSSPITNASIATVFAINTASRIYELNTANFLDINDTASVGQFPQNSGSPDSFDDTNDDWQVASGSMTPGKGYIVEGSIDTSEDTVSAGETAGAFKQDISFSTTTGTFNTGPISYAVTLDGGADNFDNQNLIGNPYPSGILAQAFLTANSGVLGGTLYFWTHNTGIAAGGGPEAYNFTNNDYATYVAGTGGVQAISGGTIPTEVIASCQSFLADVTTAGNVVFTNQMRTTSDNTNFYRNTNSEKDRLWLNMTNEEGVFRQILVGFFDEATTEHDRDYDGKRLFSGNNYDFSSLQGDTEYAIQGLPTFNEDQVVPLSVKTTNSGLLTISLDNFEGVFTSQDIYLIDYETQTEHNLKDGDYQFNIDAEGIYNNRFEMRFTSGTLGFEDEILNTIAVYPNPSTDIFNISIQSNDKISIAVYNITGKLAIKQYTGQQIDLTGYARGVYFARLSVNGKQTVKKLVLINN